MAVSRSSVLQDADELTFAATRFYRPGETRHEPKKSFWKAEVFAGGDVLTGTVDQLVGKCWVLPFKEYCAYLIKDLDEKDQFCCDTRYLSNGQGRFSKLTSKEFLKNSFAPERIERQIKISPRSCPRVKSIYSEDFDDADIPENATAIRDRQKPRPSQKRHKKEAPPQEKKDDKASKKDDKAGTASGGSQGYLIYQFKGNEYRVGNYVFVRNNAGRPKIFQIERIWEDSKRKRYFKGRRFLRPKGIPV